MIYRIDFKEAAKADLIALAKNEPKAFLKAQALIEELKVHPRTGTGHPEPLSNDRTGQWSRRITKKHRLVYEIHDTEVVVLVLTAYGHYEDK
ncbi:MAG: Txe/YoeB family addiction module toxin [Bacteroidaceae bacterium]|jgi:toxin YoeB|nr:Txe/YoeB family addiction module toxin [Bacteroidaceae bacterium]